MGVAHEINNPLAIVVANQDYATTALARLRSRWAEARGAAPSSDWLERAAALAASLEEPLRDARQAADRIRRIVRDLEVFASPDTERRGSVNVHRVLESVTHVLGTAIGGHCRLVEVRGQVPFVDGNEALRGQVFLHLLRNAIQAVAERPAAEHEIRVTTRQNPDETVTVEISDTGCGVRPEHLGRLFDPFFTTKPVGAGAGLGLWVSARIVAQLGGRIDVVSELGRGTVFSVTLPVSSTPA